MRLIDADKFLEEHKEIADCEIDHPKYQDTVRELIMSAPTIELLKEQSRKQVLSFGDGYAEGYKAKDQEIVRCKDCCFGTLCNNGTAYVCEKCIGTPEQIIHSGEWFCADGLRKDEPS